MPYYFEDDDRPNEIIREGDASAGFDTVARPEHYASGEIECIDAIKAMLSPEEYMGYLRGSAFAYMWRFRKKNGLEDVNKAGWYHDRIKAELEAANA